MARTYRRDARGRFAGGGFSGQSGGRGARLKASGTRQGGGAKMKGAKQGGTVSKPRGLKPGSIKSKPLGWAQGKQARADRIDGAKERQREAKFLRSLDKPTRKAIKLASKSRYNVLGQKQRIAINEGATTLRSNFGKRKQSMSQGQLKAIARSVQHSGRKLQISLAEPTVGRRLRRMGDERRAPRSTKRMAPLRSAPLVPARR